MSIDREYVLARWADGAGAGTIAREIGRSRGGVRRVILTAKNGGDPRARSHAHLAGDNSRYYSERRSPSETVRRAG
jgi:hypothetical protein